MSHARIGTVSQKLGLGVVCLVVAAAFGSGVVVGHWVLSPKSFAFDLLAPSGPWRPVDDYLYEIADEGGENSREVHAKLTRAYEDFERGDLASALALWTAFLAEHPQSSGRYEARFNLAVGQRVLGDATLARQHVEELLKELREDPANDDWTPDPFRSRESIEYLALVELASLGAVEGKFAEAVESLKAAREIRPRSFCGTCNDAVTWRFDSTLECLERHPAIAR